MGAVRLLLAIAVVAGHSSALGQTHFLDGGDAVKLFFVISGFYMALVLIRAPSRTRWLLFLASAVLGTGLLTRYPLSTYFFPGNLWLFLAGTFLFSFYKSRFFRPLGSVGGAIVLSGVCAGLLTLGM